MPARRRGGPISAFAVKAGRLAAGRGQWTRDGKSIHYAFAPVGDRYTLYKIDREGNGPPIAIDGSELLGGPGPWALSPDSRDLWMPVVQNQNRFLERAFWGLLRKRLPDGEPVIVAAKMGLRSYSIGVEGVYFVEVGSPILQYCRYSDSKVTDVAKLPEGFSLPG